MVFSFLFFSSTRIPFLPLSRYQVCRYDIFYFNYYDTCCVPSPPLLPPISVSFFLFILPFIWSTYEPPLFPPFLSSFFAALGFLHVFFSSLFPFLIIFGVSYHITVVWYSTGVIIIIIKKLDLGVYFYFYYYYMKIVCSIEAWDTGKDEWRNGLYRPSVFPSLLAFYHYYSRIPV